jgi:WD40 repeat protein
MREVITTLGVTSDPENLQFFPGAVREWCINTAAVDPFTKSVIVNSEDGKLYRWDLTTNQLSEVIKLSGGIGEAYTPTIIGADGTVYAINDAVLDAIGN